MWGWGSQTTVPCVFYPKTGDGGGLAVLEVPMDPSDLPTSCLKAALYDANAQSSTTSRLVELEPTGTRKATFSATCAGDARNFRSFSHEMWPDDAHGGGWLTIENQVAHFDNCTVMDKDVYHYVRNDRVVRWEPRAAEHGGSATNPMRPVASPWDYYNPQTVQLDVPNAFTTMKVTCDDDADKIDDVVYWMHASGVTVGAGVDAKGDERAMYVVSMRNLNAIAFFYADGGDDDDDGDDAKLASGGEAPGGGGRGGRGALAWTIASPSGGSGHVPSDFAFASADEAFYTPHNPRLWDGGRTLTLMDDGLQRPGCKQLTSHVNVGCYARALALTLDYENRTASRLWEFAYPLVAPNRTAAMARDDLSNGDGGTVELLENGRALVAFGSVARGGSAHDGWQRRRRLGARSGAATETRIFEIAPPSTKALAEMSFDEPDFTDGNFRIVTRAGIAGEAAQPPIDIAQSFSYEYD